MITLTNLPWLSHDHIFNVDHRLALLISDIFNIFNAFLLIQPTLTRRAIVAALNLHYVTLDHLLVFILRRSFLWLTKRVSSRTQINEISSTVIWLNHHILLAWVWNVYLSSCIMVFNIVLSIVCIASSYGCFIMLTSVTERILVTHVQVLLRSCFLSLIQ